MLLLRLRRGAGKKKKKKKKKNTDLCLSKLLFFFHFVFLLGDRGKEEKKTIPFGGRLPGPCLDHRENNQRKKGEGKNARVTRLPFASIVNF